MVESAHPRQVLAAGKLAERLRAGSAALFPTDTVPALAARPEAAAQLWLLKQRPARKPMILMGADAEALFAALGVPIEPAWRALADRCWPGAFTLVLPARGPLARALHGQGASLGLRVPACPAARELLGRSGPLATTSANRSSEPPCRTAAEAAVLFPQLPLLGPVPWPQGSGQPSTVLAWLGAAAAGFVADAQGSEGLGAALTQGPGPSQADSSQASGLGALGGSNRPGGEAQSAAGPPSDASGAPTALDLGTGGSGRWQILRAGALMPPDLQLGA